MRHNCPHSALFALLTALLAGQLAHAAAPAGQPAPAQVPTQGPADAADAVVPAASLFNSYDPARRRPANQPAGQAAAQTGARDPNADTRYADEQEQEDAYDGAEPMPARSQHRAKGRASSRRHGHAETETDEDPEPPVDWVIEDRKVAHRAHLLSLGVGAWPTALSSHVMYGVPLLTRGLIPRLNDAFHLEFGALLLWGRGDSVTLWPAAGVRWDFYLTRRWAVFFDLKMAVQVLLNHDQTVQPNAQVGFGGLLRVAERLLLRLELNYPQGLTVGLSIPLGGP